MKYIEDYSIEEINLIIASFTSNKFSQIKLSVSRMTNFEIYSPKLIVH